MSEAVAAADPFIGRAGEFFSPVQEETLRSNFRLRLGFICVDGMGCPPTLWFFALTPMLRQGHTYSVRDVQTVHLACAWDM